MMDLMRCHLKSSGTLSRLLKRKWIQVSSDTGQQATTSQRAAPANGPPSQRAIAIFNDYFGRQI